MKSQLEKMHIYEEMYNFLFEREREGKRCDGRAEAKKAFRCIDAGERQDVGIGKFQNQPDQMETNVTKKHKRGSDFHLLKRLTSPDLVYGL